MKSLLSGVGAILAGIALVGAIAAGVGYLVNEVGEYAGVLKWPGALLGLIVIAWCWQMTSEYCLEVVSDRWSEHGLAVLVILFAPLLAIILFIAESMVGMGLWVRERSVVGYYVCFALGGVTFLGVGLAGLGVLLGVQLFVASDSATP